MQLTKEIILLLTLCLSCSVIWADVDSPATDNKDEGATDTAEEGAFGELTTSLTASAANLKANITDMEKLATASKNSIKKGALKSGVDALNDLSTNLGTLQTELTDIEAKFTKDLDAEITKELDDLQTWADAQLTRASKGTTEAGIKKANTRIQSVVRNYNNSLPRTTASFEKSKENFERQVNIAVKTYTGHANNLMKEMNACDTAAARQCESKIKSAAAKVLTSKNELNRLSKSGQTVVTAYNSSLQQYNTQSARLANDKLKCENDLDVIIRNNKDENADDLSEETTVKAAGDENKENENTEG